MRDRLNPKQLDHNNPNFKYMGHEASRYTVMFITEAGTLIWIPFGTIRLHFRANLPNRSFDRWFETLAKKEVK